MPENKKGLDPKADQTPRTQQPKAGDGTQRELSTEPEADWYGAGGEVEEEYLDDGLYRTDPQGKNLPGDPEKAETPSTQREAEIRQQAKTGRPASER